MSAPAYTFAFTGAFDASVFLARPQTDTTLRKLVQDRCAQHTVMLQRLPGVRKLATVVPYMGKTFKVTLQRAA